MVTMCIPMQMLLFKSTEGYYGNSYAKCYCLRVLRVTMGTPMLNITV